jgi:hypothetical protein
MSAERVAVGIGLAVGLATIATACGAVLGIQDPIPVGADASSDTAPSADVMHPDSAPADSHLGDLVSVDVPAYETGPCPPVTPDSTKTIFVSTGGGNDVPTCGSEQSPCATIQTGVMRASTVGRPNVYVDRGTYVESVSLASGVTVQGGWDDVGGIWTRNCNPTATVIQAASSNVTITADTLGGTATIDTLTVLSKDPALVGSGESLYGIMAIDATTTLNVNVVLVAIGKGGDGSAGGTGTDGTGGGGGCTPSDGVNGAAGSNGAGAVAGTLSRSGYTSAAGTDGTNGTGGDNGVAASSGTCVACGTCAIDPMTGLCGFTPDGTQSCGTLGPSGCAGSGATGGGGGTGGGSSVALFAWDAHVTLTGGSLQSGDGGAGGNGGSGGNGGAGGAGGAAAPAARAPRAAT